jgi:N-acetylmuramoyl-L-alanine amidase
MTTIKKFVFSFSRKAICAIAGVAMLSASLVLAPAKDVYAADGTEDTCIVTSADEDEVTLLGEPVESKAVLSVTLESDGNGTDKVLGSKEQKLGAELKDKLAKAGESISSGVSTMTLRDAGLRATGVMRVFSEKYTKDKKEKAEKKAASASKATSGTLTYKYNSKMDIKVTDKEREILYRIVEAEAGDQDVYGRILVANVILNRVNYAKEWPNDIEGVVFQKNQFSPISNGAYYRVTVDDITKEAVDRALKGEDYSDGAFFFIQRSCASAGGSRYFDTLKFVMKYGCHEFYKY